MTENPMWDVYAEEHAEECDGSCHGCRTVADDGHGRSIWGIDLDETDDE